MLHPELAVREMQENDVDSVIHYWLGADISFLKGMGVDIAKMPAREEWKKMLGEQVRTPLKEKKSYCIIWLLNGVSVGHSNINKIVYGEEAYMHLHLWISNIRKKGIGTELVQLTLPYFFENFKLKALYCEPYALNPAPQKTLQKAGFELVQEYTTVPGWINFEQPVKRWQLRYEDYMEMSLKKSSIHSDRKF
jgi:RimJ/RimL family protein N-acetyltransferase